MKRLACLFSLSALVAACAPVTQREPGTVAVAPGRIAVMDAGPQEHLTYRPAQIQWRPGPPSLPAGAQMAVLEGDPAAPAVFTMRLRLPDGYQIAPHSHPNVERVTVISGAFLVGHGETLNRAAAQRLEAGSYTAFPPGMRHFAIAEGETVVQLTSVGPWQINYVNAADDPRRAR